MTIQCNPDPPLIMHIDLNSAFAMTEQQANPFLRGRPVGVTNRLNDWAICITSSYEAKRQGIVIGTRAREARLIDPNFVMIESNPDKYGYVHKRLRTIFESYSPTAYMRSVDEGIIDFTGMTSILKGKSLEDIGIEIKQRVRDEIGDYMTVNIGIAQNRWLAKVAAGFNKPNGLLTIRPGEQEALFATMGLTDLPYIKKRWQRRLNDAGIYSAVDFYNAPYWVLFRQVFKSVNGHHWYLKLRGYETDVEWGIRSVGRNYVLENRTADPELIANLLHKASVKVCRRLHQKGFHARGLMLGFRYRRETPPSYIATAEPPVRAQHRSTTSRLQASALSGTTSKYEPLEGSYHPSRWFARHMWQTATGRADQLFQRSMELFHQSPPGLVVVGFDLTSYGLEKPSYAQPTLFEDNSLRREHLENAINDLNDRYGELTVAPANVSLRPENPMKDKVPFGTVRYFD